jgi:hypothetical protein
VQYWGDGGVVDNPHLIAVVNPDINKTTMKIINKPDLLRYPNKYSIINSPNLEKCTYCSSLLDSVYITYRKKGKFNGRLSKNALSGYCKTCDCYFISYYLIEQIDHLADCVKNDTEIIKEMGFKSESTLELFCNISEEAYYPKSVSKNGIKVKYSAQSKLFENLLEAITDYDHSDYGHDMSNTLQITPGPPYDSNQRKILLELIAKLQSILKSPLKFWTLYFYETIFDEEFDDDYKSLFKIFKNINDEGHSLDLLINIYGDYTPGQFINVFRLLEHILHLCILADISIKRHDLSFSDKSFQELTHQFEVDLKSRIRYRVEQLANKPYSLLSEIWETMKLEEDFEESKFYAEVAHFRNKYAHKPSDESMITLPWEKPPFNQFARLMIKLILIFVENTKLEQPYNQ